MIKYWIEVSDELNRILTDNAKAKNLTIEQLIAEVLSRFTISAHILDSEDTQKGYAECGDINLDWANL